MFLKAMLPIVTFETGLIFHYLENPYLSREDTARIAALVNSVKPRIMLEFGCQQGRTSWALLQSVPTLQRYYGIDVPGDYKPKLDCQLAEVSEQPGLFVQNDPRFALVISRGGSFDLGMEHLPFCNAAFIDGDHSAQAVTHDSELARQLVRPPGIIIWHDYGNPNVEVTEVLEKLYAEGWPITAIQDTWLAYCRIDRECG